MIFSVDSMGNSGMKKRLMLTLVISTVSVVLLGLACCCIIWKKRNKRNGKHIFHSWFHVHNHFLQTIML